MTYEKSPTFIDASLNFKVAMIDIPNFHRSYGEDRIVIIKS